MSQQEGWNFYTSFVIFLFFSSAEVPFRITQLQQKKGKGSSSHEKEEEGEEKIQERHKEESFVD